MIDLFMQLRTFCSYVGYPCFSWGRDKNNRAATSIARQNGEMLGGNQHGPYRAQQGQAKVKEVWVVGS